MVHSKLLHTSILVYCKGKGKGLPRTGHEGPEGEQMYSSTLSLTPALDGGGWSTPRPGRFIPRKETRYPLYGRLGGPQGPVWTGAVSLAPSSTGIRSPDRPVRSESLYRLSYPGPISLLYSTQKTQPQLDDRNVRFYGRQSERERERARTQKISLLFCGRALQLVEFPQHSEARCLQK